MKFYLCLAKVNRMENKVQLGDRFFKLYIEEKKILIAVKDMAKKINLQYADKNPLFVPVLNGSFMFASDLMKELTIPCEISFIKASSYKNMSSSGELTELIGIQENIEGRDIIILEDIVDSGHTLAKIIPSFEKLKPNSIKIATLLFKPNALKVPLTVDYVGLEIPNEFIVGYGLDYNGLGRNLKDIYQVI